MTQLLNKTTHKSPYRYDIVGSFLRPDSIKEARQSYAKGETSKEVLKQTEDEAIIDLIYKQEKIGLKAVTDGEFRRSWWHLDFFWGLQGVEKVYLGKGYSFENVETRAESAKIVGKLSGKNHPFIEHFKFTRAHASEETEVKQAIPAPAQFIQEVRRPENLESLQQVYSTLSELVDETVKAYKEVIKELYEAGVRTIQFDDCTWGVLVGEYPEEFTDAEKKNKEQNRNELKELFLAVNNRVINGLPEDLTVNTHICRGNYKSTWAASGGYDNVADPLFTKEKVNAYYLEYDSDRAGNFEPLKYVAEDKKVVLGLITSKSGKLENKEDIIERIKEASQYISLENLHLSPQCGFASTEEGNILTEEHQWNKIQFIKEIAEEVWGAET